jgi:hypothetical protein
MVDAWKQPWPPRKPKIIPAASPGPQEDTQTDHVGEPTVMATKYDTVIRHMTTKEG